MTRRDELVTERLRLRRLVPADGDAHAVLMGEIDGSEPATRERSRQAIAERDARFEEDGFGVLAVVRLDDDRLIGRVSLDIWNRVDWTSGWTTAQLGEDAEIELGWMLLREVWGHGYATEAAAALRDHAFGELGVRRLISLIHPENVRSIRVAERLGAVHETDVELARWGPSRLYAHQPG